MKAAWLNLKNLYEDKWKLINKINTTISIPIKISIKNSNFIISDKLENILNQSDFVYEYEIEKMNSKEMIENMDDKKKDRKNGW